MAKVLIGGFVAGLVMNAIDFVVNVPWLGEQWLAAIQARGVDPKNVPLGGAGWVYVDFIGGIFIVWFYAAIRPRFGAGPKTAVIAGLAVWFICHIIFSSYWFMGMLDGGLVFASSMGAIVAAVAAAFAGCAMYKEA